MENLKDKATFPKIQRHSCQKCIEISNSYSGFEREKNVPQNFERKPYQYTSSSQLVRDVISLEAVGYVSLIFFDKSCYVMITVSQNWMMGKF